MGADGMVITRKIFSINGAQMQWSLAVRLTLRSKSSSTWPFWTIVIYYHHYDYTEEALLRMWFSRLQYITPGPTMEPNSLVQHWENTALG